MKKLALSLLTALSLAGTAAVAAPQQHQDNRRHYAPARPHYVPARPHFVAPRYVAPRIRYAAPPDYYAAPSYYYAEPEPDYYYYDNPYGTFNGCPPGFTIQNGVCKPYRGY